jgi:ADP-ribose pyrophosphatase YjhB (NUDIX family)
MALEIINLVSETFYEPIVKRRVSCRALVVKDGKVLLSYEKNKDVYMSPGGGLEKDESLEQCCEREVLEETGIIAKAGERLCTINEYVFNELYIANYFRCEMIGRGALSLTKTEIEHGMEPVWVDIRSAVEIFSHYKEKIPDIASLYLREYTVLTKYINE